MSIKKQIIFLLFAALIIVFITSFYQKSVTEKIIRAILQSWNQRIAVHYKKGTAYQCPLCGYNCKGFATIGNNYTVLKKWEVIGAGKRSGGCYRCGSTDRERLVYIFLKEEMKLFDNKQLIILHIAPEKMLSKKLLSVGFQQYVCGDLFSGNYKYPKHVQNINILNIAFPDNYFDVIICNHVLEHIPTDIIAMKELFRVLKKGGNAILQVPISRLLEHTLEDFSITKAAERKQIFGQADHVRIYGNDYFQRLQQSGFEISTKNISNQFLKFGLNPNEDIFIVTK